MAESTNQYSRLLWWSVENFMSVEKGKCEFDERNIINLKGYNDSGKSAMLMALKVLISNSHPTKQVEFIQDGKDYFRIIAYFSDGVMILRDKYINGQSLYEMYKDNKVIFSTKQKNGALASVKGVPEPIEQYLGLVTYEDTVLNARACFEKQIGVQTTGSENYKMFNTILKSEEIAMASTLLNNDKNKLVSDINGLESDISANKNLIRGKDNLTKELIDFLKTTDSNLDSDEAKLVHINEIYNILNSINTIKISPEIKEISGIDDIVHIITLRDDLNSINITPQISQINISELQDLENIQGLLLQLSDLDKIDIPEINSIDTEQLQALEGIKTLIDSLKNTNDIIAEDDSKILINSEDLLKLENELKSVGINYIKCPACGQLFDSSEVSNHTH